MKIPSGLSKGGLGTARDREGPYYGAFHLRLKIPLVNASHFCRDSLSSIGLTLSKHKKPLALSGIVNIPSPNQDAIII